MAETEPKAARKRAVKSGADRAPKRKRRWRIMRAHESIDENWEFWGDEIGYDSEAKAWQAVRNGGDEGIYMVFAIREDGSSQRTASVEQVKQVRFN
jgi:hypothetical protein